jgi:hypothetical protein
LEATVEKQKYVNIRVTSEVHERLKALLQIGDCIDDTIRTLLEMPVTHRRRGRPVHGGWETEGIEFGQATDAE